MSFSPSRPLKGQSLQHAVWFASFHLLNRDKIPKKLAEKVPKTIHINKFMDSFSYIESCSIFERKCQIADLIKSDVGL